MLILAIQEERTRPSRILASITEWNFIECLIYWFIDLLIWFRESKYFNSNLNLNLRRDCCVKVVSTENKLFLFEYLDAITWGICRPRTAHNPRLCPPQAENCHSTLSLTGDHSCIKPVCQSYQGYYSLENIKRQWQLVKINLNWVMFVSFVLLWYISYLRPHHLTG